MELTFGPLSRADAAARLAFTCGDADLDAWFRERAGQDVRGRFATVTVARLKDASEIIGFSALATASVPTAALPEEVARKMPRYPFAPAIRLGRLAVAKSAQGRRIGGWLLMDALRRACRLDIAWTLFLVDAKPAATGFYERFGFRHFAGNALALWLSWQSATALARQFDTPAA